jgi:hypothetical protein
MLAHLRARVPEHREVARPPVVSVRYHRSGMKPVPAKLVLHPRIIPRFAAATAVAASMVAAQYASRGDRR